MTERENCVCSYGIKRTVTMMRIQLVLTVLLGLLMGLWALGTVYQNDGGLMMRDSLDLSLRDADTNAASNSTMGVSTLDSPGSLGHAPSGGISRSLRPTNPRQKDPPCGYLVRGAFQPGSRLGNHMFVYASFYGTVRRMQRAGVNKTNFYRVRDTPEDHLLDETFHHLTIPHRKIKKSWMKQRNFTKLRESSCCRYDGRGLENFQCDGRNLYVRGYRSSFKYFDDVRDEIRREFKFKQEIAKAARERVDRVVSKHGIDRAKCTLVAIHLRRGDMVPENPNDTNFYYTPARTDYLRKVVRFHESLISIRDESKSSEEPAACLAFLIFGDDPEWNAKAVEQIELQRPTGTHLVVMDGESTPPVDMCSMTLCDHMALSVGTFGWWAGFFSRGIVTYQKEYAGSLKDHFDLDDYFMPGWIAL